MGVRTTYSIFCDHPDSYGEWIAQADTKPEATRWAKEKGWVRRKILGETWLSWVCPEHRDDVCGDYFNGNETWCMQKPGHDGQHDWVNR